MTYMKIKLSQGQVAFVSNNKAELVNQYIWFAHWNGRQWYARGHEKGNWQKKIYLHRLIVGAKNPSDEVDHIDQNGLNCRDNNLRIVTHQQNGFHRGFNKNNTSGFKGVIKDKRFGGWIAQIDYQGKKTHIKKCKTITEAAREYNRAARRIFGKMAWLNKIPRGEK